MIFFFLLILVLITIGSIMKNAKNDANGRSSRYSNTSRPINTSSKFDAFEYLRELERLHNAKDYVNIIAKFGNEDNFDKLHNYQLAGAYGGLGNAYYHLGNIDKAIDYFIRAYEQEPYKLLHKRNLISMYYEAKQYDKVFEWIEKMDLQGLKRDKDWADFYYILFKLVGAYEHTNQIGLAINVLKLAPLKSQYINSDLQDVFWTLGDLYEKNGEKKEALKWYQKLHTSAPSYKGVKEAIERLIAEGIKLRTVRKITEESSELYFPLTGGIDFTAFDFETANRSKTSACQIGVAVIRAGKIVYSQSWLINPKTRNFQFTDIHGINYEQVKTAPTFDIIWENIKIVFKNQRIVAHNGIRFDVPVLRTLLDHYNIPQVSFKVIDTLDIAKETWSYLDNYKLNTICEDLDIDLNHHEAQSDAIAAATILLKALQTDTNIEEKYLVL